MSGTRRVIATAPPHLALQHDACQAQAAEPLLPLIRRHQPTRAVAHLQKQRLWVLPAAACG